MHRIVFAPDFAGWQSAARDALAAEQRPHDIEWVEQSDTQAGLALFEDAPLLRSQPAGRFRVPREFIADARRIACHRNPERWSLLYRVLWRLTHGEPNLLEVTVDPDVLQVARWSKEIRRDEHKMHAFVRFREVATEAGPWFVAWFEPQHRIVELTADFFVNRFASMRWSILTPDECAHWDSGKLSFSAGVSREAAPAEDAAEDLWRTYYSSIFNPARVKVGAMKKEMPTLYWKNLPEASLIPQLLAEAPTRVAEMVELSRDRVSMDEFAPAPVPNTRDWAILREAARTCKACPLWQNATCTVFGEGRVNAEILVVGEQPGDQEDKAGQPFVGPAGKLFDRALAAAGVDRGALYVTNAVKHFKWEPRGKRRLHQKPNSREVAACRPWLEAEIRAIAPKLIVCLGGTAAQSVLGRSVKVTEERGKRVPTEFGIDAFITVHPSSLLRQPDPSRAESDFAAFVADLQKLRDRR